MAVEIKINDRLAWVRLVKQNGNLLEVEVDGKIYQVDLLHTQDGTFSIIENGRSYNIELVPQKQPKKYVAHTLYDTFNVEVVDAEARYLINRGSNGVGKDEKTITSPMPGKVVKILVSQGDIIKKGDTAIIISAMKMESEYKAPIDGVVKKVNTKEGETVEGNQILIEIE
ncbi:biotin/lipoyl-binding protein [Mariniphaga sediminis]|jgi:biotin carboxyl carrier protein|uniref:Biotin/lipoyl-binding protein n=2 Tax=Mariniphaga sediminis TaxID=1628158 RepID=A0A399CVZ8_9BACT|nr:biotin/lipoyl-containing protein [Mariniphaga sediminis]RIH63158.1 biotin/lipoyl-binding protein [Mariniphaga sediminis]